MENPDNTSMVDVKDRLILETLVMITEELRTLMYNSSPFSEYPGLQMIEERLIEIGKVINKRW